jgi:TP901 family phage tail tape measure protein
MALEASSLVIKVESQGVQSATDALNKLATAGDKAEKSAGKLNKVSSADAMLQREMKVWYDFVDKVSRAQEQAWNTQQKAITAANKAAENAMLREAAAMNKAFDQRISDEQASYAKLQAQADKFYAQEQKAQAASYVKLQSQADKWNAQRIKDAEKALAAETSALAKAEAERKSAAERAYANMQSEATRMNKLRDQQLAQAEAAAKRMALLNAQFSTASSSSRLSTARQASAYGSLGGNVASQYGSEVAALANSQGIRQLTDEHNRLQQAATRSRSAMAAQTAAMDEAHAMARGLSGSLGALWMTYGNLAGMAVGVAIGSSLAGIVSVGKDVEQTLEKIRVLGQATTGEIEQMRLKVVELGKGVNGPRDVAEALSVLTLAGLNAKEAMSGVGAALNLAVMGDISIERSAETLVQIGTSLGYTAEGFNHVADVVAKTAAASMSSVQSISGAFMSAAAVGEVYGASLNDIGVGLAAVANLGIQGTAAGTSLKNFYKDLSSGTDKSTKALKDMGLTLRDLKNSDGQFLPLVEVIQKLEDGFSRLNKQARPEAMDKVFGERGIKTGAALIKLLDTASDEVDAFGNKYANKLVEMQDAIQKAAAFSTLGAIAMAQTTSNQIKSVGNTLQTVLGQAFASISPQIGEVARAMKQAFNSPEFSQGLKTIAVFVADLTKSLVTHLDVIVKVAAGYAAWKLVETVAGIVKMAQAMNIASIAAAGFTASLGPIAIAIMAMGAAWAIYKANKDSALNNNASASNLQEYSEGVMTAAEQEREALEMRKKGMSELDVARKAQLNADKDAAAAAIKESQKGLEAMKSDLDSQYAALSDNQKKRIALYQKGEVATVDRAGSSAYIESLGKYNDALTTHANQVKVVTRATEELVKARQANAAAQNAAAKASQVKPTGTGELTEKPAKEETQRLNFIKQEREELEKLTASYNAKSAAIEAGFNSDLRVMSETQAAIVEVNRALGKYGSTSKSNPVYQDMLATAQETDAAKFRNENDKKLQEFVDHLKQGIAGEEAFQKAAESEGAAYLGTQRRKAEYFIQNNKLADDFIGKLRDWAEQEDAINKAQDARAKIQSATNSSITNAGQAQAEIDAMETYGVKTKATALELARLAIAKAQLSSSGDLAIKQNLLEAASTETLTEAYRDLLKNQLSLDIELEKAQADSLTLFGQSEAERVRIAADSQAKIAALKLAQAQSGFDEKAMDGTATFEDVANINAAQKAYAKTLSTIDAISKVKLDNIAIKNQVDQWKDLGKEIENSLTKAFGKAGEAAGKMFSSFADGQADQLKYTKQISGLQEAQDKDGIDRTKEIKELQISNAQSQLSSYGGMAEAAKGFFDENSRGYQAMTSAVQILQAAEMALSVVKGVNAILTQGSGDPYSAFARMAAMTAVVAALGVAVSGGSGGGMSSADKQSVQGTGSVLGSQTVIVNGEVELVGAKSESIANSLSILEKNSGLGLVQDKQMLNAMYALSTSIEGLAAQVVQVSGITGTTAGKTSGSVEDFFDNGLIINNTFTKLLTGFVGKVMGTIFGGSTEVVDTGFTLGNAKTLGQTLSSGVNASQYSEVKTDGGWFSSDDYDTALSSLGASANDQFTKVIQNMANVLESAADVFGVSGDAFTQHLQQFVIDIGEVSLKGLSGDDLTAAINAVFSKLGDDMAMFAFSELQTYQAVGEGMLETISRVANDLLQVQQVFEVLGKTLPSAIASIATSEKLIASFGSVENLTSGVSTYMSSILTDDENLALVKKSVESAMSALGLAGVTTKEQFKSIVEGLDLTNDADIALFNSLMNVAEGFGQVADAADEATQATVDALQETIDSMQEFADSIAEFKQSLYTSDLSNLTPTEQVAKTESYYNDILAKAMSGDTDAQSKVTDAASSYLEAMRTVYASSSAYDTAFASVQQQMDLLETYATGQVSDAQKQIDELQNLNATAADILSAVTPATDVSTSSSSNSDSSEQISVIANGLEAIKTTLSALITATVNTNAENADTVVAGLTEALATVTTTASTALVER